MLHSRNEGSIRDSLENQRSLFEGWGERGRARSREAGTPEDHAQRARARLRSGDDPHHVAAELHDASPEAHDAVMSDLPKGKELTAFHAVGHAREFDKHSQAYDKHIKNPPSGDYDPHTPDWEAHHTTEAEILAKQSDAWRAMEKAAEQTGVNTQRLLRPRQGEEMHGHLRRLLTTNATMTGGKAFSWRSRPGSHVGAFATRNGAESFADAANHHWGKDHETKTEYNPREDEWLATTTERGDRS